MKYNLVTVDTILSKLSRELKNTDINESDVIEWIGEAMDHLKMPEIQEQAVAFLKVKNFESELPCNFASALQLANYTRYYEDCEKDFEVVVTPGEKECIDFSSTNVSAVDIIRSLIPKFKQEPFSYFDVPWGYNYWVASESFQKDFCPIRLADHVFFNSVVCQEKVLYKPDCCTEEYTIVGTMQRKFRFSFREGVVALVYNRLAVDPTTGYPLIPDDISHISAISYYVRWKIAESESWNGREGFKSISDENESKWLKYVKQAKNKSKMLDSLDQFQNNLEGSHYLIPDHNRYYKNFRNLGRTQTLNYKLNGN